MINKLTNTYLNGDSSFANIQINYMITEIKDVTKPIISSAAGFFSAQSKCQIIKERTLYLEFFIMIYQP